MIFLLCARAGAAVTGPVNHSLKVEINPAESSLAVTDALSFPAPAREFTFTLHQDLNPSSEEGSIELLPRQAPPVYGINFSSAARILDTYRITLKKPAKQFSVKYSGTISHPLGDQVEEYSRSFSETPGIISPDGCYLSGASGWYPGFGGGLVSFRLETVLPAPYLAAAGGERTFSAAGKDKNTAVWKTSAPQDEINLACGKYSEYAAKDGRLDYYAFLRSPDPELAAKYLEADAKYIGFYSALIGPYPYGKFALVENFWETGYGVPSFTLLGPKVIRLPFILNSSYPHEILHNWWGNGVFVDYEKGNWCEGLTVYLADYLIAENRGKGRDYRMTTLQKYSDYVSGGKDFPLTEFRSRHSSASEAVGYGKALMFYHMLRNSLGDENFKKGLRDFYAENKFKTVSFEDLRRSFEKTTGGGRLKTFFDQWTTRAGAPALTVKNARVSDAIDGYELEFTLAQTQEGAPYALEVPAAIYLENSKEPRMKTLRFDSKEETFHYSSPLRPVRIEIDPEFDIFRKLNPLETPPTLSRVLGAEKPAIILPSGDAGAPWQGLASSWAKDRGNLPLVYADTAAAAVPADASYWVLGGTNRFAPDLKSALEAYGARFTSGAVTIGNRRFPDNYTFVFTVFNPANPAFSGALVISGATDKLAGLASKLPHYGKYSWLVFDADMNSTASGVWPAQGSPLALALPGAAPAAAGGYPRRRPLAQLPSAFSADRIKTGVAALAQLPGGRGQGSPGLKKAAAYIAAGFKDSGLKPYSGASFMTRTDKPGRANIIGAVEGSSRKEEAVVLCAHYDHLPAKDGAVFPGADDNASGVALLLELARHYAAHPAARTIIFAAFDGEETGKEGSRAFLASLPAREKEKINAALNFDTVGRLEDGRVLILGGASSDKWAHIFRGAGFVTGTEYDLVKEDLDSSDQVSFIEAGLPAVQFFSGPKTDYHKPSDTADKIDAAGIVKQAEFAGELIDYLAGDSDFITRPEDRAAAGPAPEGARKVSTGLVPDFSFQGTGVRAVEITPASPLAAAGLKAGDVIIKLAGQATDGLRAYSDGLKRFSPGQKVSVTYLSDGVEKTAEIELAAK